MKEGFRKHNQTIFSYSFLLACWCQRSTHRGQNPYRCKINQFSITYLKGTWLEESKLKQTEGVASWGSSMLSGVDYMEMIQDSNYKRQFKLIGQTCFNTKLHTISVKQSMLVLSEDNFKVLIRVRPLNSREKQQIEAYQQSHSKKMKGSAGKMIKMSPAAYSFYTKFYNCNIDEIIKIQKKNHTIAVADPEYKNTDRRMKPYTFSGVYDVLDRNATIFTQDLKDHVSTVLQGYNCTILAYGITGSGKTYTVFGPTHKRYSNITSSNFNTFNANQLQANDQEIEGISYLTFQYLLKQKQRLWCENSTRVTYKVSFVQIYNENVRDLLTNQKQQNRFLNVVQDYKGNTSVADVHQISIQSIEQVYQVINAGNAKRAFASTIANQYSSRSHAILQVMVEVEKPNMEKTVSKLYIIDLAGSEKIQTLNCSRKMQQGANINRSLLALGNCINLLAENSRKNTVTHIPYRDSKLTRMLKDSLGGNTKTIMIACISPNPFLIDQTMTTLNYAMRAQGIKKKIIRNQVECDDRQEFLCLKCKRSSKHEEQNLEIVDKKSDKEVLGDRTANYHNNNNMRSSLDLTGNHHHHINRKPAHIDHKRINQRMQVLESLYEDIISNIRESESIKTFGSSHIANDPEWLKIKCVNQEQRIRLKQVLLDTFKNIQLETKGTAGDGGFLTSERVSGYRMPGLETNDKENQNELFGKDGEAKSLSQSKSRRRRSHNKFQIVRKSEQECKTIDFQ